MANRWSERNCPFLMKNKIIAVMICCLLAMSCGRLQQKPVTEQADTSYPSPLFEPHKATLAQQKMCDEQAAKRFNEYTTTRDRDQDSYTSHYDPAVNVCYVRINQLLAEGGTFSTSVTITDAFEGQVYASYFWSNPEKKKYWEVAPSDCQINVPGKDSLKCTSSDEFDDLTTKYFGTSK
jgi:hypothetical protein